MTEGFFWKIHICWLLDPYRKGLLNVDRQCGFWLKHAHFHRTVKYCKSCIKIQNVNDWVSKTWWYYTIVCLDSLMIILGHHCVVIVLAKMLIWAPFSHSICIFLSILTVLTKYILGEPFSFSFFLNSLEGQNLGFCFHCTRCVLYHFLVVQEERAAKTILANFTYKFLCFIFLWLQFHVE